MEIQKGDIQKRKSDTKYIEKREIWKQNKHGKEICKKKDSKRWELHKEEIYMEKGHKKEVIIYLKNSIWKENYKG